MNAKSCQWAIFERCETQAVVLPLVVQHACRSTGYFSAQLVLGEIARDALTWASVANSSGCSTVASMTWSCSRDSKGSARPWPRTTPSPALPATFTQTCAFFFYKLHTLEQVLKKTSKPSLASRDKLPHHTSLAQLLRQRGKGRRACQNAGQGFERTRPAVQRREPHRPTPRP